MPGIGASFNFNNVARANDLEKQSIKDASKDNLKDNVVHVNADGKINKDDLLGALKNDNTEVFIKKEDGTVYKANVKDELAKLNTELSKNQDICIDFCVTDTKTETKELPPNMEAVKGFDFKLSDGKGNIKKELKEMGINLKDGLDKKEVETIVNKLRAEGADQKTIDAFLKEVNGTRQMKKNDQTLDIKTGDDKVDYSVEDKTVKKGPREKVRDGEFKLPSVNVEKVRKGELKLPSVHLEKEGKFEFKFPKLNIDYKKGNREEIKEIREEIKIEKGLDKEAKGLEKEKGKLETRLNELEAYSKRKTEKGECIPENITKEMTEIKSKISTINDKFQGNKDCEDNTAKDRIKELKTEIKENRGKLTIDPEKGKLELPKIKVDVEPGKVQLPKFKVDVEPGKLQLPKWERPKIQEKGFDGSVPTKEEVTTTTTDCDNISVDKTPEPNKKTEHLEAYNNYKNNEITNDKNYFTDTEEGLKYKETALSAFNNKDAKIEIKCSGDKNNLEKHGLSSDAKRISLLDPTKTKPETFRDKSGKTVTLTQDQLLEDRQSNLKYEKNILSIESSASIARGSAVIYNGMNFDAIGDKGKELKSYFDEGNKIGKDGGNSNDYLSVGRGLEMAGDLVQAAFDEFKTNNPGKGKEEFLAAYGEKEISLTKGNDKVKMPDLPKDLNVEDIMKLYDIK